jgi:hypothetical protein
VKIDLSWLSLPVGLPLTRDRHNGCRAHDADDRLPGNPCDRRVELLRVRTRDRVCGFSRARRNCGPAYMMQGFSHSHLFGARRHDHRASGASARHEDSPDDRRASPMYVHRLRHAHESALRESYDRSISSPLIIESRGFLVTGTSPACARALKIRSMTCWSARP